MKKALFLLSTLLFTFTSCKPKTACECLKEGEALEVKLKKAPTDKKDKIEQELNQLIKECYDLGIRDEDFDACQ
jgi:hypothetical protein